MTRTSSLKHRPPAPQHAKRLRPKTYSVAVYLVGLVVVFQVVMIGMVFWLRAMVVPVNVLVPKGAGPSTQASTDHPPVGPTLPAPPSATGTGPGDIPSLPSLAATSPHLALLSVPGVSDKLAQVSSLNDQAQMFQHQNDFRSALDALLKAEAIDPRNPNTLKNLAETYYLMSDAVRSKIYWQRLVDLGAGVGTVYAVAKDHVLLLNSTPDADALKQPSVLPRLVYINDVTKTPVETQDGQPQFHLRTVLMRKDPKMAGFDQKKLRPYVIFYQQMPDGKLVPDLGQHGGSFEDTFLFWNNKTSEPFGVDYLMPVPGSSSSGPNKTTAGEYYGFVIGIYYDNALQDSRSEPSDLVTRMPLPFEIE